jgi:hypothetical protein
MTTARVRMTDLAADFDRNVFINCPFDLDYHELLRPLLFVVVALGFHPRIALERSDSGELRLTKIAQIVKESRFSIHDLSRLRAGAAGEFYRLNMPFELGVEYGGRLFGRGRLREKRCLILEDQPFEFMRALSDLAGVDVKSHQSKPFELIHHVRNWFVETVGSRNVPSAVALWESFLGFSEELARTLLNEGVSHADLRRIPVPEYIDYVRQWLQTRRMA